MSLTAGLRRWFLQPPRPHGEVIDDRRVSFLELFYDVVYVVLAVWVADAATTDGEQFAITYSILLAVLLSQWASVYRRDAPEYRPGAVRYLLGLVVAIVAILAREVPRLANATSGVRRSRRKDRAEDDAQEQGTRVILFVDLGLPEQHGCAERGERKRGDHTVADPPAERKRKDHDCDKRRNQQPHKINRRSGRADCCPRRSAFRSFR